ncbi:MULTISPECIES: WXG100 family type VII secretion target [Nocardia]|uniref:WXG100 family type VII secretion target n=1 Tax=Nocardia TaxID=1817 RepID=UPI000B29B814|nr:MULTISPECIES: hypothetical protein [Nocardia]
MGDQFWADLDQLHALAPEFDRIGSDVHAAVERLRHALAAEGAPWGDDDAGKSFANSYLPEQQRSMLDLSDLVKVLQQAGPDLRQLVTNLEDQDRALGQQVGDRMPGIEPSRREATPSVTPPAQPLPSSALAPGPSAVETGKPPATPRVSPPGGGGGSGAQQTPVSSGAQPPSRAASGTRKPSSEDPRTGGNPTGTPPAAASSARNSANPSDVRKTAAAASTPWQAAPRRDVDAGVRIASTAEAGGRAAGDAARTSASSRTPWSTPSSARAAPRVSAPESGSPPRASGPRGTKRPEREPASSKVGKPAESLAARLARELAERHGVQAFGFETPGVSDDVLRELTVAVHDVLPIYPAIDLRAIGLDELPEGELTRLEWDADGPAPYTVRIVLAARAAVDPGGLERTVAAAERLGMLAPGSGQRPVYSSIVRELGGALDVAGGFAARSVAHRALVATYLSRPDTADRGSLGRVVAGFRRWRAQLSGRSFQGDRFDPAAALSEAFTDVVLNGEAVPPARVLHGVLADQGRVARAPRR